MDRLQIIGGILSEVSAISNVDMLGAATRFDELGFDSLDCIVFTAALEDRFDVSICCGERIEMECISDAVDLVERLLAKSELRLAA